MNRRKRQAAAGITAVAVLLATTGLALGGAHTWRVNEMFTNSCGDIQFIELREINGGPGETGVNGHNVTSNSKSYTIPGPALTPPTGFKTLLFATPAFAALPGVPTPDYIFPAGSVPFFSAGGDTVKYIPYSTVTFGAGICPTNGILSLSGTLTTATNSPRNYAGATIVGGIDVSCSMSGDVNNDGAVNGDDIPGFIRVITAAPIAGDKIGCANYCGGTLAANIAAFVNDLLN